MGRSYALIWCAIFVVWLGIVWANLGSGAAFVAFWTGMVAWGIGRTWDRSFMRPPSAEPRDGGD